MFSGQRNNTEPTRTNDIRLLTEDRAPRRPAHRMAGLGPK